LRHGLDHLHSERGSRDGGNRRRQRVRRSPCPSGRVFAQGGRLRFMMIRPKTGFHRTGRYGLHRRFGAWLARDRRRLRKRFGGRLDRGATGLWSLHMRRRSVPHRLCGRFIMVHRRRGLGGTGHHLLTCRFGGCMARPGCRRLGAGRKGRDGHCVNGLRMLRSGCWPTGPCTLADRVRRRRRSYNGCPCEARGPIPSGAILAPGGGVQAGQGVQA
jgi:hypothetical protein